MQRQAGGSTTGSTSRSERAARPRADDAARLAPPETVKLGHGVATFSDRRIFPRRDLLVSVRPPGTSDGWMSTRDVSAGGMRLLSERALGKGDDLELEILLPDGSWMPVTTKVACSDNLDVASTAEEQEGLPFLALTRADLEAFKRHLH